MTNLDTEVSYTQNSPGSRGRPRRATDSAHRWPSWSGDPERAVIVGVPDDVDNSTGMVNVIPFGAGGTRGSGRPGSTVVPGPGSSRFGGRPG